MCLLKIGKPQIATKNMIVYKHIRKVEGKDSYETSYQFAPVVFNKVLRSTLNTYHNGSYLCVDIGLHSYVNEADARRQAQHFDEVLVQCTITKGSTYYEGLYYGSSGKLNSIASNKLRYDKIISDFSPTNIISFNPYNI